MERYDGAKLGIAGMIDRVLVLYSKPDCHLCEGLREKLEMVKLSSDLSFAIAIRDITTDDRWFAAFQYEIPVLRYRTATGDEVPIARPSPRCTVVQLEQHLRQAFATIDPSTPTG